MGICPVRYLRVVYMPPLGTMVGTPPGVHTPPTHPRVHHHTYRPPRYTSRVHRRSSLTALEHHVVELNVRDACVTDPGVTVRRCYCSLWIMLRRVVPVLWAFSQRTVENCQQRCEEWSPIHHPFHCWVLVIPGQSCPHHGAITGVSDSSCRS